ncbi:MAG: hypothetical protein M4579_002796 [Chaenotheca gracillima]|nr:MAG: hypothetical protein M4579_002796 [Chaenotheca gracillima]
MLMTPSEDYKLIIRQGPIRARVAGLKEKGASEIASASRTHGRALIDRGATDRKPVDPPPIVQLKINDTSDPAQNYLQSPYFFMCCNLHEANAESPAAVPPQTALAGTLVSSLHRLKDVDNTDGGFFVFGDLSVKLEGNFRLRFSLFEMIKQEVVHLTSIISETFTVFPSKTFPGMAESTFLSRSFGDQGVRLRIRKEPRTMIKRAGPSGMITEDYPRPYSQQMAPDPKSAMSNSRPQSMVEFGHGEPPSREYPYGESSKRHRTSFDNSQAMLYDRDAQYNHRGFQVPYQQQSPYFYGPHQPGVPNYLPSYQGPHSAPPGAPDQPYRQAQSSTASSPFESPTSQRGQRSPGASSVGYTQQPPARYQPQQGVQMDQVPTPMHVPYPQEPSQQARRPQHPQHMMSGQSSPNPVVPSSSHPSAQTHPEYTRTQYSNPMPMRPPPTASQRPPEQLHLPPLDPSTLSNPQPPPHTPPASTLASTPSGYTSRYPAGAPPRPYEHASLPQNPYHQPPS